MWYETSFSMLICHLYIFIDTHHLWKRHCISFIPISVFSGLYLYGSISGLSVLCHWSISFISTKLSGLLLLYSWYISSAYPSFKELVLWFLLSEFYRFPQIGHRVGHDWSDAAAAYRSLIYFIRFIPKYYFLVKI